MAYDMEIATMTLWMEASAEPEEGKRAVAHVLVNRSKDPRWGPFLAAVCLHPLQFSCWNTSDPNRRRLAITNPDDPALAQCKAIIEQVTGGEENDFTNGSTHYYSPTIPEPFWVKGATFCGQFGTQIFYRDVK